MSHKLIAKIALGLPLLKTFDYSVASNLSGKLRRGSRVRVVFNRRNMVGYTWGFSQKSNINKINPIVALIDKQPLFSEQYLSFLSQLASYYCVSIGEMIETALPLSLREGKPLTSAIETEAEPEQPGAKFDCYVYRSDDEEKKFHFFSDNIKQALKKNKQVIVLLPHTDLLGIWQERLKDLLKGARIICWHSRLKKSESFLAWLAIKSGKIDIVIGLRQAIFAPLARLGLIIVDREDSFVYKQETRPYYNGRDVAIMLAKNRKATLILSSISPSLDCFSQVLKKKFRFSVDLRDNKQATPIIKTIDLNTQSGFKRRDLLPSFLTDRMRSYLNEKKKILIFLNRKGFATYVRCRRCAHVLKCNRCSSNLIHYYSRKQLSCPHCTYRIEETKLCPSCSHNLIYFGGFGTERIESEVYRLFPGVKIACIDSMHKIEQISSPDIIITTQFGLKEGLIKDRIGLCIVISVDNMLNFVQLRAGENTFRILLELRALTENEMIIQTYYPENRVFKYLRRADYEGFAKEELEERRILKLPPLRHLISIQLRGPDETRLKGCAEDLFKLFLRQTKNSKLEIFPPLKDSPYMLRSKFRLQILVKTVKVEYANCLIYKAISKLKAKGGINIGINVDV